MNNAAVTIEVEGLRVYRGAQSEVAIAYPKGGPKYGIDVARRDYKSGAEGEWRSAIGASLTEADLAAIAAAPRVYTCG